MASESSGSSVSSSSSTPTYLETPENAILDQLSSYASDLAGQMNNWAQNTYAQTSNVTDQAVNNFFNASTSMTGLAGNMINQYNDLFAPENAQLVSDANSYASPERMAVDMGMAGATQAQAGDQAIKNSEQNLLSYGIDPSAGRYAALDKASAVQNAANVAGAENLQRNADIATGQKLRQEAVQVGSQLPGAISNAENTAIQANTGASNAKLANANTGANLFSLPDKYLQTAMSLKLPPTGQKSSSIGSSQQSSSNGGGGGGSGGGSGGGGGGYGGGGGGGGYQMPDNTSAMGNDGSGTYGGGSQPDAGITNVPGGGANPGGDTGGDFSPTTNDGVYGGGSASAGADMSGGDTFNDPGGAYADGGDVPFNASPSQGQRTDDVRANLNAGEFVVPEDVARWKGAEFFHNLIAKSRKTRAMSPVGGHPMPQGDPRAQGQPTFSTR